MSDLCDRCGVRINRNDKRSSEKHCGFCSHKLGINPDLRFHGNMNIVTDPTNASQFIIIGIAIIILSIVLFSATDSFDSFFKGAKTDKEIARTVKQIHVDEKNCQKLQTLKDDIKYNKYSIDSERMIDAKLLQCDFNKSFPELELKVENRR